jgi:collagen type VI alpha
MNGATCKRVLNYYVCHCGPGFGGETCNNFCSQPGDLVIALDSSGSIGLTNFLQVTTFASKLVQSLDLDGALRGQNGGFRVGLLTFSTAVNPAFQLNAYNDTALLLNAIGVRYIDGSTDTADAISVAANQMLTPGNGSRPGVPDYLLIITDGLSDNPPATWTQAMLARQKGISIVTVGVSSYNYSELRSISSAPESSTVFIAENFTDFTDALATQVSALLCRNNDSCSSNPCMNGAHCTSILGGYSCGPCPSGTSGFNCQRKCSAYIDLVFVIDASGSVQWERMPNVTQFLIDIVGDLDIGPNSTQVGAIYFNSTTRTAFTLNQYTTRQDIQQALRAIPFLGGMSNVSGALRTARTSMFQLANGDRPAARNIVVLITNGYPTIEVQQMVPEAVALKNTGALVVTVAISHPAFINFDNMLAMASPPVALHSFNVSSYTQIDDYSTNILSAICNDGNECGNTNPCQNGGTCLVDYGRYLCKCTRPNTGFNCERQCSRQLDVVFVLDLSGSIEEDSSYVTVVDFVRSVIAGLDVQNGLVRVGVVTFATTATNEFYLKTYVQNGQALQNAIEFSHPGGTTNAQAGLSLAKNQFTSANGDRSGIPNVVVYVSDGYSDVLEVPGSDMAADQLKNTGVTIYSVGLTDNPNIVELWNINSDPDNDYYVSIGSNNDYTSAANQLLDKLCA